MRRSIEAELVRLRAARDRYSASLKEIDLEIGRVATKATKDELTSKSSIARVMGVSHTHIGNLMKAYAEADIAGPAVSGIPIFVNSLASKYVQERGSRIVRSISGFNPSDALLRSDLDPRLFNDEGSVRSPEMLWKLESGEWIGVGHVSVGYNGTGCDFAVTALVAAGVPEDHARRIVSWRFCDAVDITDPDTWEESRIWPVEPRTGPRIVGDRIIVDVGEALNSISDPHQRLKTHQGPVDETGFYASVPDLNSLEAWLGFLDRADVPEWAQGPRVARVLLTEEEARTQGFVRKVSSPWGFGRGHSSAAVVVVEQGFVQIWGHFYRPQSRTQLLPPEAYDMLEAAKVYPSELAARDNRWPDSALGRFFADLFGPSKTLPPSIDISDNGARHLSFTPGLDAES
ncbi:hypothetical protein ABH924_003266 [Arthrobacter sp. GAS37]|uniref:hypothetical protein n=1 Tax=Arthrobacter sp. GAS37 TaxID=3156261 RepID=UPI0038361DCD